MTSAGPNSRFLAHKYGIRSVRIDWDDSRTLHIFQPSTTARAQRQSTPEQPGQQAKQHSHRFMQKFRARTRSIHKAAHPKQCTVLYRANGCRGMRAAESGSGEERAAMALTALQCPAPCTSATVATCRPDAEEDGALGRRKAFDASTRVTHACTEAGLLHCPPASVLVFPVWLLERNQSDSPPLSKVVCIPLLPVYTTFTTLGCVRSGVRVFRARK